MAQPNRANFSTSSRSNVLTAAALCLAQITAGTGGGGGVAMPLMAAGRVLVVGRKNHRAGNATWS